MNESFVFYRSFFDGISKMSDEDKLQSFNALCRYALDGAEPIGLNFAPELFFSLVKPQIDANTTKRVKGAMYGKLGGRPRKDGESSAAKTTEKTTFKKPTVEEIKAYCEERGNNIDARQFYDFYESKGWKVGNAKMKDWKASIRTWEHNQFSNNATNNLMGKVDIGNTDDDYYSVGNYNSL